MAIIIRNTPSGLVIPTEVCDEDGNPLPLLVEETTIRLVPGEMVEATLKLGMIQLYLTCGKARWITKNPKTDNIEEIAEIKFRDGTKITFSEQGEVEIQ